MAILIVDFSKIKSFVMTTTEMKSAITESIEQLDDHFIRAIHAMIQAYISKDDIVGYELDGTPISQGKLEERIAVSEQQIKDGKYVSANDLKAEMKAWRSTK